MQVNYTKASFKPLTPVAKTSFVLVVRSDWDIFTYQEFLNYANKSNIRLGFWHEPTSKVINRWVELAGIKTPRMQTYTGSTTQLEAFAERSVDFGFDTLVAARANKAVRIIAVLDNEGAQSFTPDVACLAKLYPGIDIDNWYGIVAPAGLDPDLTKKLQQVLSDGFKQDKYRERLEALAFRPWNGTAQDFEAQQDKTIDFYRKL